ncbi:MAG: alcohol dehydrogenase catalytic domain-containing protein [Fimbriimonas sp.]|nr:alcohol dehydrogenase catalytic domain-containing protein [Fimbriimonas sp.]
MRICEELPETMPAGVLEAPGRLVVQTIPVWQIESYGDPDMVLIRVASCGVCGSDFRYYQGENPWAQHTLGRFVPNPPNIVLGHEYSGTVVAICDDRNAHLLGKRVASICFKVCGECSDCLAGRSHLCEKTIHMGHGQGWGQQEFFPGAYARYVPSWGSSCFELPRNVTFEEAAMMDILAVCVHVAVQGQVQPGRAVLTIGAGPAGNGIAQASKAMDASRAVLLDRSDAAIQVAQRQGIGEVLNTQGMSQDQIIRRLRELEPFGYGTVFDTVGSAESFAMGLSVLGKAGTFVAVAVHDEDVPLNICRLGSERRIVTSCNFESNDYPKALAWLTEGKLRVKEWLTPIRLEGVPNEFARITREPEAKGVFKLLVDPWA